VPQRDVGPVRDVLPLPRPRGRRAQGHRGARPGVDVVTGLLTARETSGLLGVSTETVLRWVRQGKLPAIRLPGGAIRFRRDEIEAWLTERATPRRGVLTATPGAAQPGTLSSATLTATEDEE
jgi:excisionase family DNA binding protein